MSEEATIEHPLSTHSASVGTRRKPSGKLHSVVRCAAMLVMLLTIGSGNAWGVEFTPSSSGGWTSTAGAQSGTKDNVTIATSNGVYNTNLRVYKNATFTVSSAAGKIESIVMTGVSGNPVSGFSTTVTSGGGTLSTSGNNGTWEGSSSSVTLTASGAQVRMTKIVVTTAGAAYTVTATRNNNSYGTVSVSGTTITATPADCYQVISGTGGYTVTSGTATVTHTGTSNTLTVTPSTDCTVQVNFEKKTVNTYVDEIQGNDDIEECDTHDAPSLDDEDYATSGTCAQQHWHFAGWTTAAYKASPEGHITTAGTSMTADGTTYYAVWAKGSAGSSATVTFSPTSDGSTDINSSISSYVASSSGISSYSGTKVYEGAYGLKLGTSSATGTITCTLSSSITTKTITIDAKQYGSDTGTLSCTVNGSTTFGSAQSPSSSGGVLTFTNATSVAVSSVSISTSTKRGYVKTITVGEAAVYSDYITTCCTALGTINGSVSWTNPTEAVLTWNDMANASSYAVTYRTGSDAYGSSNVSAITTNGAGKKTCTITGLSCNTNYDFKIAVTASSGYCDKDSVMENKNSGKWTVTHTLSHVERSSGQTAGSGVLCGDYDAVFAATSGYTLPSSITVTGASSYTWTKADGSLHIDAANITGDITVTITGDAETCTGQYCINSYDTDGNGMTCFTGASTTRTISDYVLPSSNLNDRNADLWVGYGGAWVSGKSANWHFRWIPLKDRPGGCTMTLGVAAQAIGTLTINSGTSGSDNNYELTFDPNGYGFVYGSGESWSSRAFVQQADPTVWRTEVFALTSAEIGKNYYVGLAKYGGGYVKTLDYEYNDADEHIWGPSYQTTISGMGVANGISSGTVTFRGSGLSSPSDDGQRGFYEIWSNNCNRNFYCHFVPVHRVIYDANWPVSGEPAATYSTDVSVEESGNITVPAAPSAPTGYHFVEWNTAEDGSGTGYNPDDTYTISAGASADVTLYAIWSNTTAITLSKNGGSENGSAVGTYGSNVVGSFVPVTRNSTTYRLLGYSKSGTPAEIVIDAEGNFVANTTYTDASGNWTSTLAEVTLVAQWQSGHTITWMANGETHSTSFVDTGETLVLPGSTPTSCDDGDTDTYTTFIGWYSTAAGTNSSPTASISSCGTKATTSIVPDANQTYYAVWGNGTVDGTTTYEITTTLTKGKTYVFGAVKAEPSTTLANNTAIGAVAFATTYSSCSWGEYVNVTPSSTGVISSSDVTTACIWTLENISSGNYSFKKSSDYVYLKDGTSSNSVGTYTSAQVYITDETATCKDAFKLHPGADNTKKLMLNTNGSYGYRMYSGDQAEGEKMCPYIRFYEQKVSAAATGFISSCCASPAVVTVAPDEDELELDIDGEATTDIDISQTGGGAGRYYPPTVSPAGASVDFTTSYKTAAYTTTFTATAAGTYTVKGNFTETSYGCAKTGSATITVAANPILTPSSNSVAIDATCGLASSATDITVNSRYLASTSITASVVTSTGTGAFKISSDNSTFDASNKTITGGTTSKATSHIYVRYDATEGQTGSATGTLTLTCGEKVVNIPLSATVTCSAHVVLSSDAPIQITAAKDIWVEAACVVNVEGSYLTTNSGPNSNVSIRAYTSNAHFQIKTGGTTGEGTAKTSQGSSLSLVTNHSTATWSGSIGIVYKPAAHNTTETATLTVEVYKANGTTIYDTKTYTLYGRSLPENFVIAVTDGSGNWFAVPADMVAPWGGSCSSGLSTYKPYPIEVDNTTTPTAISGNTPSRAVYTAVARSTPNTSPQTLRYKSVTLSGSGNYYLYGSSTNVDSDGSNTNIQNATFADSEKQKWFLDVVDWTNKEYNMHLATTLNTNVLAFTTAGRTRNVGQYAANASTTKKSIYILPATSTCDNYNAPENITCDGIDATNYTIRFKPDRTKNYEVSLDGSSWSDVTTRVINNCTDDSQPTLVEADIPLATYRGETVYIRVKAAGSCAESTTFDVPDPSLTVNAGTWLTMTGIAGYAFENTENSITIEDLATCAGTVNVAVSGTNADKISASINSSTGVVTISMTAANAVAGTYNATLTFTAGGATTRTQNVTITIYSYAPITISSPQLNGDGYYCKNSAAAAGYIYIDAGSDGFYDEDGNAITSSNWGSYFNNKLYDITDDTYSANLTRNASETTDHKLALNLPNNAYRVIGHTYQLHFNDGTGSVSTVYNSSGVPYAPTVFEFTCVDCSKPTALAACPVTTTSFTAQWYDPTCAATNSTINVRQAGDPVANVTLGTVTVDVDGNTRDATSYKKWHSDANDASAWFVSEHKKSGSSWVYDSPVNATSGGVRLEKADNKGFVFTPQMGELYPSLTTSTTFKVTVKAYYWTSNTHQLQCFATTTQPSGYTISPTSGSTIIFNGASASSWTAESFNAAGTGTYKTYTFTVSNLTSTMRLGFGAVYAGTAGFALSAVKIEPISDVKSVTATCSTGSAEITGLTAGESYFYTVTNNGNTSSEMMVDTRKAAPSITYFPAKVDVQADVNGSVSQVVTFTGKNFTQCDVDAIITASTKTGSSYFTVTPGEYTYTLGTGALSGSFTVTYNPTAAGEHTGTYSVGDVGTPIDLEGHACPAGFGTMATGAVGATGEHSATVGWSLSTTGTVMLAQGTRINTELLSNGGFELGLAGWDETNNMSGDICTAVKRTGSNSRYCTTSNASIYVNGRSGFCGVYSEEMTFLPGTYTTEAYVRHAASSTTTGTFNAVDNEFYIGICKDTVVKNNSYVKFTSVKANADYSCQFNNEADAWKKVDVTFTLTEKLTGRLFIARKTSTVAYFFLDDVSLQMTAGGTLNDKTMFVEGASVSSATSVELTGLKPQTTYSYYVLGDDGCESNIATFTTQASVDPITITATPSPVTISGPLGKTVSTTMSVTTTNAYANVIVASGTCTDGRISVSPSSLPADGGVVTVSFTPLNTDEMGDNGSCVLQLSTVGAVSPTSVTVNWAVTSGFDPTTPVVEVVDISNSGMNVEHNVQTTGEATVSIIINRETTEEEREDNVGDELFFSKYYEANQNVKLVAIFNPTNAAISLAGTYIWLSRDASEYWGHNNNNRMSLAPYGKTPGQIGPMEEIIFYRYETNETNDTATINCAMGKADMSEWNRVYSDVLSFSGNDALLLVRDTTINNRIPPATSVNGDDLTWRYIAEYDVSNGVVKSKKNFAMLDIIGARTEENYPSNTNLVRSWSWTNCKSSNTVENGDAAGWIGYGQDLQEKGSAYYNCGADPLKYGYLLSTNRCLLIRLKTVKNGSGAIQNDEDDFVTLGTEWQGSHVPLDRAHEVQIGCDNFSFVGGYDYAGYYNKWTPLGEDEVLPGVLQPDGSYYIEIVDGTPHYYCKSLYIQVAEKTIVNGVDVENVHVSEIYKVPIVVDASTTTADANVFRNADDVDPVNTLTETICNTCDVVVRNKATLTNAAAGQHKFHGIELYAGSKLDLNGQNMELKTISMDSKNDTVSYAIINTGGTLSIDTVIHIKRVNDEYWYPFSLPYDCKINTIRQLNGKSMGKYEDGNNMVDSDWGIKYYDGKARQQSNSFAGVGNASPHWKYMPANGTLKANVGYIIGLFTTEWTGQHKNVYFPPVSGSEYEESNAEGAYKEAAVSNWNVALDGDKQNHGWNFVGSPYISIFNPSAAASNQQGVNNASVMIGGKVGVPDYTDESNVYVSVPDGAASRTYTQKAAASTKLEPFRGYFVQVKDPTNGQDNDDIAIRYSKTGRTLNLAPSKERKASQIIEFEVLFGTDEKSDNAGILVDSKYDTSYELGYDLIKMYTKANKPQIYTQTGGYNLAYNALSADDVNNIPLVMYAPKAGTYTVKLDEYSKTSGAEAIYLLYNGEEVADLLFNSYEIEVSGAKEISGYAIRIVPRKDVPTDIDIVPGDGADWNSSTPRKFIYQDKLYILRGGNIYDATGKQVKINK